MGEDFSKEFEKLHGKSNVINAEIIEDNDSETFKKYAKKKKKKKDKSASARKLRMLMDDFEEADSLFEDSDDPLNDEKFDEEFLFSKKTKKGKARDLFNIKQARKEKKKNIEARFSSQLTLLRKILKDSDLTAKNIRDILDKILASKSRYTGKTLTDLLQALNTANTNRASIVRDIANINKTIIDLSIKQDKSNPKKKDEKNIDNEEYGISLFKKLLSGTGNHKDMVNAAKSYYNNDINYDPNDNFDVNDDINARLSSSEDNKREDEGTKYIQYENMHPEDVIIYDKNNDNWDIDAIDGNGNEMPEDYPRLEKQDLGKVHFDIDQGFATDEFGRKYKIIRK